MPRETLGYAARCGHHINIHIAVILACEGDLRSVGGEIRAQFPARAGCQPFCLSTLPRNRPQVAGVDEDNCGLRNRGLLKKCPAVRVDRPDERQKHNTENNELSEHEGSSKNEGCLSGILCRWFFSLQDQTLVAVCR